MVSSRNNAMVNRFGITEDQFWSMIEPEGDPVDCRLWLGEWDRGYGVFHFTKRKVLVGTIYHMMAYRIAFELSPRYRRQDEYEGHISHLCGLAPCCNPLHLFRIPASQNIQDGVLHRQMLREINPALKPHLNATGVDFKEAAKRFDIPPGIAFRLIHGKMIRENYPARFVSDLDLIRQPAPWYVKQLEKQEAQRIAQSQKIAPNLDNWGKLGWTGLDPG